VPLLSQASDLGSIGYIASDGALKLSVFKVEARFLNAFKRFSQLDQVRRRRVRSEAPDEFSAPTMVVLVEDAAEAVASS
jgi:hypothetical protein